VLCVNDGAEPPTTLATTGTVSTTLGSNITFAGFAFCYGITFTAGSGANAALLNFNSSNAWAWIFDSCTLALGASTSTNKLVANGGTSGKDQILRLINTKLSFANAGHTITPGNVRFEWFNTPTALQGTVLTTLFVPISSMPCQALISGVDLSAMGSGKNLVSASITVASTFRFQNCKFGTPGGSAVSLKTGTIAGPGGVEIYADNCDNGDHNYYFKHYKSEGAITQEDVIVRTGGASDGTTPVSHRMVSLSNAQFVLPFSGPWMTAWNDSTSSITVTVEIVHDNVTALKDDEVWLEVEYPGTANYPESVFISDRKTDIMATGADQTASAASWTTTGLTNPNTQKLAVTFTPTNKGPIRARVMLAKASYTIYVDPLLTVA
jgi:hypothetical protein